LGAVWVGIYPVEERMEGMRQLLGIPSHVMPLSIVSVGNPAEKKEPPDRFKPERIHYDQW
jgi:nitroreductase